MLGAFSPSEAKGTTILPDVIPVGKEIVKEIDEKLKKGKVKVEAVYLYINRLASSVVFVVSENGKKMDYVEVAVPKPDVYLFLDKEKEWAVYKATNPISYLNFVREVEGDFAVLDELVKSETFGFKEIRQFPLKHYLPFSDWDIRYLPVDLWNDVTRAILIEKGGERIKGTESENVEILQLAGEPEDLVIAVLSKDAKYLVAEDKNIPFKILSYSLPHREVTLQAAGKATLSKRLEDLIVFQVEENIFPKVGVEPFDAVDLRQSKLVKISGVDRRPLSDWKKALKKDKDATIARLVKYLWENGDANVPFAVDFIKVSDITTVEASKLYSLLEFMSILDLYSELFGVIRDRSWQALGDRYVRAEGILNDAATILHKQFRALRRLVAEKIVESFGYTTPSTIKLLADALVASQRRRLSKTARQRLANEVLAVARAEKIDEQVAQANKVADIVIGLLKPLFETIKFFVPEDFEIKETQTSVSFGGLKRKLNILTVNKEEEVEFAAPFYYKKLLGFREDFLNSILDGIKSFKGIELDKVNDYFKTTESVISAFNSTFGSGSVVTIVAPENIASIALLGDEKAHSPLYTLVSGSRLTAKEARSKNIENLESVYRRFITSILISYESGSLFGDKEPFFRAGSYLFNLANAFYGNKLKSMLEKVSQKLREKIPAPKVEEEEQPTPIELEAQADEKEIEEGIKESVQSIQQQAGIPEDEQNYEYMVMDYLDEEAAKFLSVYEEEFSERASSVERLLEYYNRIGNKINRLPVILDNFLLLNQANDVIKAVVKEKLGDSVSSVPSSKAPEIWDAILQKAGYFDARLRHFFEFMLVGSFLMIFRELASFDDTFKAILESGGRKLEKGVAADLDFFLRDLFIISSPFVKAAIVNAILSLGDYLKGIGYPFSKKVSIEPFSNEWLATLHEFALKQDRGFWGLRPAVRKFIRDEVAKVKASGDRPIEVLVPEEEQVGLEKGTPIRIAEKIEEKSVINLRSRISKISSILSNILFLVSYLNASDSKSDKVIKVKSRFKNPEFQKKLIRALTFIVLSSYLAKKEKTWRAYGLGYIKDDTFVPTYIFGRKLSQVERIIVENINGQSFDKFYANAIRSVVEGLPASKVAEEFLGESGLFGIVETVNSLIDELSSYEGEAVVFHLSKSGEESILSAFPVSDVIKNINETANTSEIGKLINDALERASSKVTVLFSLLRYAREYVRKKKVDLSTFITGKGKGKHEKGILKFLQEVTLYNIFDTISNYARYYYRLNAYFGLNSPTAELKLVELFNRLITSPSKIESRNIKNLQVHELDLTIPFYNDILATQSELSKIEFSKLGLKTSIKVVPNTAIYEYLLGVADIDRFRLMSTPETGFPNILPYFAAYLNTVINDITQQKGLGYEPKDKIIRNLDAKLIRAHYAALKQPVPSSVPLLMRVQTREIYPRGVESLITTYESLVKENIGRMLELSEYVQQSKLYHTVRAGVFLNAILADIASDTLENKSVTKELLSEINRLQKGLKISGNEDVAVYGNVLRAVVKQIVAGGITEEVEPIFLTPEDAVFAVQNLNKLYDGNREKFIVALNIMLPFVYTYADLLTVVANIRKKSFKDIKDSLSLINWFRQNVIAPLRTFDRFVLSRYMNLTLTEPLLEPIGVKFTLNTIDNNLKVLIDSLMKLNAATHEAAKGSTAALESAYTSFRSNIRRLIAETGISGKGDFAKAYYALKVFSNLLAFEEYIYDSVVRSVPDSNVSSNKTSKKLLAYKQKTADLLILDVHDKIIKVGFAATLAMPNATVPTSVLESEKLVTTFSKISGRIKSRIDEIAETKPDTRKLNLSVANTVVIRKLVESGLTDYASVIAFIKRWLSKFFEEVGLKEIPELIVTAVRETALETINALYSKEYQEAVAKKAEKGVDYYEAALSLFHTLFTKAFNKKISRSVRNSAITLAVTSIYKDMLSYLAAQKQKAVFVRTPMDAIEAIKNNTLLFLDTKKAEISVSLGTSVSDVYSMAVTNLMVERLGLNKDKEKVLAVKAIVPFLFLTPSKYVDFLKRHNIAFEQKENAIETAYDVVAKAVKTLTEGENAVSASVFLTAYLNAVFELYTATKDVEAKLRYGTYPLDTEAIIVALLVNLVPATKLLGEYFYYVGASLFAKQDKEILELVAKEEEEELEEAKKAQEHEEIKEQELRKFLEEALYSGFGGVYYLGNWGIE